MTYIRRKGFISYISGPLVAMLILCGLFGIVWLRSKVVTVEYAISELENNRTEKIREAKMLLAERASALSMQKVEKATINSLGLRFPDRTRVLYVKERTNGPQRASFEARHDTFLSRGSDMLPQGDGAR